MEHMDRPKNTVSLILVDDDKDLLWLMSHALRLRGFQVEAFDHAPSLAQIRDLHPSVILLDVEVGEEICGKIKGGTDPSPVPVILLSRHPIDKLRETVLRCGADGYLIKPFNVERLTRSVHRYAKDRPVA
jgi:DNA-binding response OmpR family regulator